jgi:protein-disulfide isomerase-like protein with CxxC motif
MTNSKEKEVEVFFNFDPACPWTWRTSLWLREVRQVRPITIHWGFVSLAVINSNTSNMRELGSFWSQSALQLLVLVRRQGGDAAVDKLYLALGQARHVRGEDLDIAPTLEKALVEVELDPALLAQALADSTTLDELQLSHDHVMQELKAIGSPTLVIRNGDEQTPAWYGPIINTVPQGEAAGQFWDNISVTMQRDDFFELKRNR